MADTGISLYFSIEYTVAPLTLAADNYHSLAVDCAGNLWTQGNNYYRQLWNGTITSNYDPVKIIGGTNEYKKLTLRL